MALKVPRKLPRLLTMGDAQSILNSLNLALDRLLLAERQHAPVLAHAPTLPRPASTLPPRLAGNSPAALAFH